MRDLQYIQAINEAMHEEMRRDDSVFVIGEDVDQYGGVFKATVGLCEAFGARRVRGTPISEAAFTGLAVGAALKGLHPVVEFMYFDFVGVAMDPLINQMAKLRTMSGGQLNVLMTVRAQTGARTREAAQHSNSLEAWFVHVPGIKVVMPATVYDAKGLLKAAIREPAPVLYIENRLLYYETESVPEDEWLVPLGQAEIARQGKDVTVVALGWTRRLALAAAQELADKIDLEVIDPRSLQPFDLQTVLGSVEKTGRLIVVHDAPARCGFGAEVVRQVVENGFDYLDAEPIVVGGLPAPMPFSPVLEDACVVTKAAIVAAIRKVLNA